MAITIKPFTEAEIEDVLAFERQLRQEEPEIFNWAIDEAYEEALRRSFVDPRFANGISLLAYQEGRCVGRIDANLLATHFAGDVNAYLDWICVLKSVRHQGVAQELLRQLRQMLKQEHKIGCLVALIAANEEAQRFYRHVENAVIRDEGIWMD